MVYPGIFIYVMSTQGGDQRLFVSLEVVGLVPVENPELKEFIIGSGLYQRVTTRDDLVQVRVTWHANKNKEGELINIPIWVIQEKCRTEMQAADIGDGMGYPEPPAAAFLPDEDDPVTYAVE
tara:strand:- start:1896 stop:2261 length:366 start_codon:yes stop_codon:yes gene_type:complete